MTRPSQGTVQSTVDVLCVFSILLWTLLVAAIAAEHYNRHQEIAAGVARIVACEIYGPAGALEFAAIPWTPIEALSTSYAKTDLVHYVGIWLLGL